MKEHWSRLRDAPVFICGHPKSGTSLLRNLLDGHPELVVYPEESVFFRRYWPRVKAKPLSEKLAAAERYLTHIFEWNLQSPPAHQAGFPDRDYTFVSFAEVNRYMRQMLAADYRHDGDILAAAVLAYGMATATLGEHTRRWVEKTPYNERFAAQIFKWWPNARCIHIVRDPRDNYVSYRRKHPEWTLRQFAASWRRSTRKGWYNQRRFAGRYLVIAYEDLARTPKETLARITDFLNISWDDVLLQPSRAGQTWQGNSMFGQRFTAVSPQAVGRWQRLLKEEEACRLERLLSPWLEKSGYRRVACLHTQYSLKDSLNIGLEKFKMWLKETKQWRS